MERESISGTTNPIEPELLRALPVEVRERRREWRRHFKFWRRFNISVGTAGAAFSACAATDIGEFGQYLAALAAVCIAVLGFAHADRRYMQYVRAWRILDNACHRYKYEEPHTLNKLIDAMERGEKMIAEYEHLPEDPENV